MESEQKKLLYEQVIKQLQELFLKTGDPIAHMATTAAVLYHNFDHYFWCGFYRLIDGELTVGPYQGSPACQVLKKDTGVCWAGIKGGKTVIVADVHRFPGHIACDSRSASEIVVPVRNRKGEIAAVLDVDSDKKDQFDETDASALEKISKIIF
ncbi:MAG: L-methionine (R)-S-oxide reductase [Thermodesulfobacteriota bacterium]|nr:L-methionine (R)-S-oxide reductase [Thermodesulfobacteriota bacterium]